MNITGMESLVLSFCLVLARVGGLAVSLPIFPLKWRRSFSEQCSRFC